MVKTPKMEDPRVFVKAGEDAERVDPGGFSGMNFPFQRAVSQLP
jgi:hypothetical protein